MQRILILTALFGFFFAPFALADDTTKAADTRKKVKNKISVDFKNTPFKEIIDEIKDQGKVNIILDTKGGISQNKKFNYKGKDKTVEEVLNEMLETAGWGWYIKSKDKDAYDGVIMIRVSDERGTEKGS